MIGVDGTGLAQQFAMMMRTTVTMLGLAFALSTVPAAAAENGDSSTVTTLAASGDGARPRPQIVPSLYASLAALQVYDGYSTLRAMKSGALEANPLVGNAAGRPIAIWSIKAASTAATIYWAERLWRTHRRGPGLTPGSDPRV